MTKPANRPQQTSSSLAVVVVGTLASGSGYPNAENTIAILKELPSVEIRNLSRRLSEETALWRLARASSLQRCAWLLRLLMSGLVGAVRSVFIRSPKLIYIPHPSLFTGFWLSLVPERWRPRAVLDLYISVWDSMFNDRRDGKASGWASLITRWVEGRAIRGAWRVVVDTEASCKMVYRTFGARSGRVVCFPLAIDARLLLEIPRPPIKKSLRVLFIGTFVPLHGTGVIAETIFRLRHDRRFLFRVVGDGQMAESFMERIAKVPSARVEWYRGWMDSVGIASEIENADICLGVFGGAGKASRVLPFKVYQYLAAGRPVVTQSAWSLPSGVPDPPVVSVDPTAESLEAALIRLAMEPESVVDLGLVSRSYYLQHLSSRQISDRWSALIEQAVES